MNNDDAKNKENYDATVRYIEIKLRRQELKALEESNRLKKLELSKVLSGKLAYFPDDKILLTPNGPKDFSSLLPAQGILLSIFKDENDPAKKISNELFIKRNAVTLTIHGINDGRNLSSYKREIKLRTGIDDLFPDDRYMNINSSYLQ
jgi:hypothetical protein